MWLVANLWDETIYASGEGATQTGRYLQAGADSLLVKAPPGHLNWQVACWLV